LFKAIDLQPMDLNGLADPFLVVKLGKHTISDKENHVPNSLNPVFGNNAVEQPFYCRCKMWLLLKAIFIIEDDKISILLLRMFELTASIPIAKDLIITVMDWDLIGKNEVIGETTVDLENRLLTRFRATCGIPQTYCISGINRWRDSQKPREILDQWAENMGRAKPRYFGNTRAYFNGKMYALSDYEEECERNSDRGPPDERLALHILNGIPVVPEHVETRALYSSLQPNMEQGKLQMWVDIFPRELGEPGPPFDISPRVPQDYVLRVIIWNTSDVILEDKSITGEAMSDIYVKG
ncbi:predicted protein, partial [Nematostella vectensis]